MKQIKIRRGAVAALMLAVWTTVVMAQTDGKTLMVYYDGGRMDAFPAEVLADTAWTWGQLRVKTVNDTAFFYNSERVDSAVMCRKSAISDRLPSITQLKLNNKYNDQVYTDVIADIIGDSLITASIGCIGRWLTPSIQLSDESARVYVGSERQKNKVSRRSFADDVNYTVALPGQRVYRQVKIKDEVWSEDEGGEETTKLSLTAAMFSSNLPGKDGEGFAQMLDGNPSTFFHSTWDVASGDKQRIYDTDPYLDIALPEALRLMCFSYTTRDSGSYWPVKFTLLASNDGSSWRSIRQFSIEDGMPQTAGADFMSDIVDLGAEYTHLRFYLDAAAYRRYLVFAEFGLYKVEKKEGHGRELLEPAEYAWQMQPFGRDYRVHIDWLADASVNVPRVYINVESSYAGYGLWEINKENFTDATIRIDGGEVFPSMDETPVQIKGRGNSSWSSWPWDKNPYRLKFPEKQKPFGLTNGKNWVLLANKQSGSMTTNAVGMKAACLVGTAGANHIVPVELYIDGQYRGSYNFTEKVGLSNNSISLDDESRAVLLELDTYYDETYKFYSSPYSLPVNIKKPDFAEDNTQLTQQVVANDFNNFLKALSNGQELAEIVDITMLARYLFVNDLILNHELKHPKSTFLYNAGIGSSGSMYVFGPVWDLDWGFGYEESKTYFKASVHTNYWNSVRMEANNFVSDLRYVSKQLDRAYYGVWKHFANHQIEELLDFCDDYFAYARPSFENNANSWDDGKGYQTITDNAKAWLRERTAYIGTQLTTYNVADGSDPVIDSFDYEGDASGIEVVETSQEPRGSLVDVYDLNGRLVKRRASVFELRQGLAPGIYIVGGKKMVIRN